MRVHHRPHRCAAGIRLGLIGCPATAHAPRSAAAPPARCGHRSPAPGAAPRETQGPWARPPQWAARMHEVVRWLCDAGVAKAGPRKAQRDATGGGGGSGGAGLFPALTPLPAAGGSCPGSVRKRPAKKQAAQSRRTLRVPKPCCPRPPAALAGFWAARSGFGLVIGWERRGEGLASPSRRCVSSFLTRLTC